MTWPSARRVWANSVEVFARDVPLVLKLPARVWRPSPLGNFRNVNVLRSNEEDDLGTRIKMKHWSIHPTIKSTLSTHLYNMIYMYIHIDIWYIDILSKKPRSLPPLEAWRSQQRAASGWVGMPFFMPFLYVCCISIHAGSAFLRGVHTLCRMFGHLFDATLQNHASSASTFMIAMNVLCIQVCGCHRVSGFCGQNPRTYDSDKPVTIPEA